MRLFLQLTTSDTTLVRQALADDPRALETLVVRHSPKVHAVVRAVGVPASSVDDAVQDAFLSAVRDLRQLRDPARFGPWLVGVARNAARQWLRKQPPASGLGELEPPGHEPEPREALEASELRDHVHRQVLALPEEAREAVFVYYYEGRSTRAAARALGISTAALWHRLERARDTLRHRLWRLFTDSLEASVPSRAEWRTRGRRLSLVLMAAVPAAAVSSAAQAAPTLFAPKVAGGIIVSGKKVFVASAIAACIVAGGVAWIVSSRNAAKVAAEPGASGLQERTLTASESAPAAKRGGEGDANLTNPPSVGAATRDALGPIAIAGRVLSTEGGPIGKAAIKVVAAGSWQGIVLRSREATHRNTPAERVDALRVELSARLRLATSAETSDDGRFEIRGELDEGYLVFASHEAHLPRSTHVHVVRGSTTNVEIELPPGAMLEGVVVSTTGAPVPEAEVRVERNDLLSNRGMAGVELLFAGLEQGSIPVEAAVARSGTDGSFRFTAIEPVEHEVLVRAPGYLQGRVHDAVPGGGAIRVVLDPGAVARGRILLPDGSAAVGADVRFEPVAEREVHRIFTTLTLGDGNDGPAAVETTSDTAGRFEALGLAAGTYRLGIKAAALPELARDVEVKADGADLGDIVLSPAASISGVVLTPSGAPAAGARVEALVPARGVTSSNTIAMRERDAAAVVTADSQGRFTLSQLAPGEHDLTSRLAGFASVTALAVSTDASPVELRLGAGLEFRGRFVDLETGAPVADVRVEPSARAALGVESDSRGEVRLSGIPPEMLRRSVLWVNVKHADYESLHGHGLPVWTGGELPILRLSRREVVAGVVLAPDGSPIAGARVSYETHHLPGATHGYNPLAGIETASAADGSFLLDAPIGLRRIIGAPRYLVRASHRRSRVSSSPSSLSLSVAAASKASFSMRRPESQ